MNEKNGAVEIARKIAEIQGKITLSKEDLKDLEDEKKSLTIELARALGGNKRFEEMEKHLSVDIGNGEKVILTGYDSKIFDETTNVAVKKAKNEFDHAKKDLEASGKFVIMREYRVKVEKA